MEIIISVSGGVVQDVFCSSPEVNLTVIDWDTEDADPNDAGIVPVKMPIGRDASAHVDRSQSLSFSDLAGTDVQRAIKAAKIPVDDEPVARRFVLYDFDADELATSQLYSDRAEACQDADELDNVIVLAVAVPCAPDDGGE